MKYQVQWDYRSGISDYHKLGRLSAGAVIDIPIDVAEHINRDSPGVLVRWQPAEVAFERRAEPAAPEFRSAPEAPEFTPATRRGPGRPRKAG